ncbi:MAG: hypothetical protein HY321_02865 [Armatimonadetes bacterium]|nr:hypothetical protein [Armatimonadota bacterium]
MRTATWCLTLLWLAIPALPLPTAAAPDAARLVERAFRRPRSVAHTGTVEVTVQGVAGTALVKVACDGQGRERREHVDGPARGTVVLTDGRSTWQRGAGGGLWKLLPPMAAATGAWDRLRANYDLRATGSARVAGRASRIVEVVPRHPGNPKQVLWLDTDTALVLRSEARRSSGEAATASVYTSVALGAPRGAALAAPKPEDVAPLTPPEQWEECSSLAEVERRVGERVPLPAELPPGYALSGTYVHGCWRGISLPVLRYEDGVNALTLFVARPGGRGWGRSLRWGGPGWCRVEQREGQQVARSACRGYHYVLIGDHRPEALEAMLRSIR